jgi:ribonuclease P protein component
MQRIYRLTKKGSFTYIYQKGETGFAKTLKVCFVKTNSVKVGVSVSKKIGKSVVRSLVKRRIKEAFRMLIPTLLVKCNYVVVAKEGIAQSSFSEIKAELVAVLKKLGHINNV